MATVTANVREVCAAAKSAAHEQATATTKIRDAGLNAIADAVEQRATEILVANDEDVEEATTAGLDAALLDRLALDDDRVAAMAAGVREIVALPDPVGEEIDRRTLPNGLELRKVRVPIGVVAVIYEARPNVTVDAAALTLKSGNAIVLRGSSYAQRSNAILASIVRDAAAGAGLPEATVSLLSGDREELKELATQDRLVDLLIPRGGEGLKETLKQVATVPVIYAASGNCHVYVHEDADLELARRVAYNAKVQRPGVCNAAETLLVNREVAAEFLPGILDDLRDAGVELVGDEAAGQASGGVDVGAAADDDWDTEYLGMKMAVGVVDSLKDAIDHVNRHGTGHSEAIITTSDEAADRFAGSVDAAAVYVNASTRFTDGFEYGMGAEIGNSTQKLHARGPIGLHELTTTKYVVRGEGHVRE
jgi:glutamate-5-semialdehyde dehydrogenase